VKLVDANVLLYAVNEADPQHERARTWLDASLGKREAVGFAWVVILAFLRIATRPEVFPRPLTVEEATSTVSYWLGQPSAVSVDPTPRHLSILAGLLRDSGAGGNLVTDAHLAALALDHQATVVTFDRDFARFEGVKWEAPGRQEP
jgi:uncharacterized protein